MKTQIDRALVLLLVVMISNILTGQELGLQLYSLRNQFKTDIPGTLKIISDNGITKVEGGDSYGMPQDEFKNLLKENDIDVVSVGASFEDLKKNPEKIIENAKSYGATYAVCFWIPHTDTIFTINEAEMAIKTFNASGKKLKAEGINLVYHPHGFEFRPYQGATLMDYIIKKAEYFNFEMDVYWFAHPGENPLEWLRRYPEKFKLMHLKDCQKGYKGNQNGRTDVETNVNLGTGQIDIAGIVLEAKKIGVEYLFIEDESSRSVKQIPESYEYIKSLLE